MQTNGGFQSVGGGGLQPISNAGAPTAGVNEVQALTSTATGGTFTITFVNPLNGVSKTTTALAWNIATAALQAALDALSNMPSGGVVVGGGATLNAGAATLTFAATLAGVNVAQVTVDNTLATGGTVVPSTSTAGVGGTGRGRVKGTLLIDTTNGTLYQNTGTPNTPAWTGR